MAEPKFSVSDSYYPKYMWRGPQVSLTVINEYHGNSGTKSL